jgi:CRP/FNR family transcriptional regulator, cyclic AMP receptor protein
VPSRIDPGFLQEIALLRGLPPDQMEKLLPMLHERSFPQSTNVITAEEPGEGVYAILSGTAKVYVNDADGSEFIIAILGPGEVVGEMSLADSLGRSANVLTLERSSFLWMDRRTLLSSMDESPVIARNLAGILSRRLRLANTHARSLAVLDVQGRVAAHLLAFASEYGEGMPNRNTRIPLRLTQSDLAALVGASRVRVNQALGYYRRRGAISVSGDHRITIHDQEALERRAR